MHIYHHPTHSFARLFFAMQILPAVLMTDFLVRTQPISDTPPLNAFQQIASAFRTWLRDLPVPFLFQVRLFCVLSGASALASELFFPGFFSPAACSSPGCFFSAPSITELCLFWPSCLLFFFNTSEPLIYHVPQKWSNLYTIVNMATFSQLRT